MGSFFSRGRSMDGTGHGESPHNISSLLHKFSSESEHPVKLDPKYKLKFNKRDETYYIKVRQLHVSLHVPEIARAQSNESVFQWSAGR